MAKARFLDPSSIPLKRNEEGNIWATLVPITVGAIVVVLVAGLAVFFFPVINKTRQLQSEKAELQRRIAANLEQQRQLLIETEYLKNNPRYLEGIARDRLNLGRPGETIFRFDSYLQGAIPTRETARPIPNSALGP